MSRSIAGAVRAAARLALDASGGSAPLGAAGARRRCEGERRLLAAVLEDAIACFQHHRFATRPSTRRLFEDAEAWLFGPDGEPFSFESVCEVLAIDADWLRARLLASAAAGPTRPAAAGQMSAMLLKNSLSSL